MVSGIDLTESLKELAVEQLGVDLLGVTPVGRLEGGPEGGRPTDYMPQAKSVVVCAAKIPDAVIEVAGHYEEPGKTLGPYMWYGYPVLNWDLFVAARRLVGNNTGPRSKGFSRRKGGEKLTSPVF